MAKIIAIGDAPPNISADVTGCGLDFFFFFFTVLQTVLMTRYISGLHRKHNYPFIQSNDVFIFGPAIQLDVIHVMPVSIPLNLQLKW